MNIFKGEMKEVVVRQEGDRVLLLHNGTLLFSLPWQAALELGRALHVQGKKAEEEANAVRIVYDQAILTRVGFPVGLSNRPDILAEAAKEAAWNRDLRRYIRGDRAMGIANQTVFGTPTISVSPPKKEKYHGEELE